MKKYPEQKKTKMRIREVIVIAFIALFAMTGCSGELFESLTTEAVPEIAEETAKDATLQDSLFSESIYAQGGSSVQITAAGDASYEVWFAPEGTSSFVAGPTMTMTSGDSSEITAPADEGEYRLYIVYPDGTVSAPSLAVLTVDNTPPKISAISTDESGNVGIGDTIDFTLTLEEPINVSSGSSIEVELDNGGTIIVSGPQSGTTVTGIYTINEGDNDAAQPIGIGADPISANGTVTDRASNVLDTTSPGSITFTNGAFDIDTDRPTNAGSVFTADESVQGGNSVAITDSMSAGTDGEATDTVWFVPTGMTVTDSDQFIEGSTMTKTGGDQDSINAPTAEGTYYLYVVDDHGNVSSPSAAILTVDNTVPVLTLTAPSDGAVVSTKIISYELSEDVESLNIQWVGTGGDNTDLTDAADRSAGTHNDEALTLSLTDGEYYTIKYLAEDAAGNSVTAALTGVTVKYDSTSYSAAITYDQGGNTAGPFKEGNVSITLTLGVDSTTLPAIAIDHQGTSDLSAVSMTGSVPGSVFTYTYAVHSHNEAGYDDGTANVAVSNLTPSSGSYSSTTNTSFVIDTTVPSAPSSVSVPSYSDAASVTVNFTEGTDTNFNTHNLKACTDSGCSTGCVGTTTDTASPAVISGLSNGSTYYACVQSADDAGNITAFVPSGGTVTVDTDDPAAPSGVAITQGDFFDGTTIDVTFTDGTDTNFDTHNLKACTNSGCSTGCVGAATYDSSPGQISGLGEGSTYYACVESVDKAGRTSGYTPSGDTVTIDTTAPAAPSGVAITQGDDFNGTTIDITFTDGTDTTQFDTHNLMACTDAACSANCVGSTTDDSSPAQISGLVHGSTYYACVQSVDRAGTTSNFIPSGDTVAIDTSVPAAPSVPDLAAADDTSFDNDNITLTTTDLTFTGTSEANASIEIFDGITSKGTATANGSGDWTIDLDLPAGSYSLNAKQTDAAGNESDASGNLSLTVDTTAPSISSFDLANSASDGYINVSENDSNAAAALSATGHSTTEYKVFASTETCSSADYSGSSSSVPDSSDIYGLIDGGIYKVCVKLADTAGNTAFGDSGNITLDKTVPVISSVAPASSSGVNNTLVSYTFSEICDSGNITWTRTGGSADSNHPQSLAGAELNAGAHNNIVITDNPSLVDGATYTISWDCTDRAGNAASTVSSTGVTYSDTAPEIASAETMDTDNDGKIDTYRIAFNKSIVDSTFPGYIQDSEGSNTTAWLVAGYADVRLIHGSEVTFASDAEDDAVIYLRFDESPITCDSSDQSGCDTGAKPDLTTTASPGLEDSSSNALVQVASGDVTEADGARPLLITAKSLSATAVDVIFSEAVEETTSETASYYSIDNGITVSAAQRDGSNYKTVHLTTSSQTGGDTYTLTVNTDVKDLANFNLDTGHNTALFDGNVKPIVVGITTVNATTLIITFNETVTAASAECANLSECSAIYSNSSLPVKAAVSTGGSGVNSATFTLTVNDMVEGQNYTTSVLENTVTSVVSGKQIGDANNSATFIGDGRPGVVISPDTATECHTPSNIPPSATADTRVVIEFDQAVGASALVEANYKITMCLANGPCSSGTGSPNSAGANEVTAMGGNKYAVDFGSTFDTDTSLYQMSITNVQDSTGNTVAAPTNLGFRCGSDVTGPSLIKADVISSNGTATQVMLTFSESVEQVSANTSSNYKYDTESYGTNVNSAARQSNTSQVIVIFEPGLSKGGHQIRVQNVEDLASNAILDNGTNNVQPIVVNPPEDFGEGPWFDDPFSDGTEAGFIVKYDGKLYLGADSTSSKIFEVDYSLTTSQTITLDSDGIAGAPYADFVGDIYDKNSVEVVETATGIDFLYAACVGSSSVDKYLTGSACGLAGGEEMFFVGARNDPGSFDDLFYTTDTSDSTLVFTFDHQDGLESAGNTYRLGQMHLFKEFLYISNGDMGRGGPPYLSRVCVKSGGCSNANSFMQVTQLMGRYITRLGKESLHDNSAGDPDQKYANIDSLHEYDADGASGNGCDDGMGGTEDCISQLYMANGGWCPNCNLSNPRTGTTSDVGDGGVVRTTLHFSTASNPPDTCGDANECDSDDPYSTTEFYDDVTPASNSDWYSYASIPPPLDPDVEWQDLAPVNTPVPSMWAVPYMRTAPNGDLYLIRNACSTTAFQSGTAFATNGKQVCPPGSEVPQLWMMKSCASSSVCPPGPSDWVLVAEGPSAGTTNMAGNTGSCGTSPNECEGNTHLSLLEFVGDYIYIGYDNGDYGANVWRADMSSVSSGSVPLESSFTLVNDLGIDDTASNQKIFSHITVYDGGKNWLILATRDGTNAMRLYRTSHE